MISERIKALCEKEDKTVKDLAIQIGMKQQTVQKYTSGNSKPGYEFFAAMYQAGYDLHWLISGTGNMYRNRAGQLQPPSPDDGFMPLLRWLYPRLDTRDRDELQSVMQQLDQQQHAEGKK